MALPLAVPIAIGAAQAGAGILGAFGKHQAARDQARAQNQAAVNQYKQRLKIREGEWAQTQNRYANALSKYTQDLNEFDRAAAQGYGREMLKQNEALRGANLNRLSQSIALASRTGAAAAAGKRGSGLNADQDVLGQFVRNRGVLAENLLSGQIASSQRMMDINNRFQSARNQAYSKVAINPKRTIAPMAPNQVSGPSTMSLLSNIGSSIVSGASTAVSLAAPNVGGPTPPTPPTPPKAPDTGVLTSGNVYNWNL